MKVDFPEPDGPVTATKSPRMIFNRDPAGRAPSRCQPVVFGEILGFQEGVWHFG